MLRPEDYDRFTFSSASLVHDILTDADQINSIDCLMIERPPLRSMYSDNHAPKITGKKVDDCFYNRLAGKLGRDRLRIADPNSGLKDRVKSLQYCWFKPSMRKLLINWWTQEITALPGKDKKHLAKLPFHFALLSTRMRFRPWFKWKKATYVSQLEQVREHWQMEDDISNLSLHRNTPFLLVTMLEANHKKEQMESLIEVFGEDSVVFLLLEDRNWQEEVDILPSTTKNRKHSKSLTSEYALKMAVNATTCEKGQSLKDIRYKVKKGIRGKNFFTEEQLAEARENLIYNYPRLYLCRKILALRTAVIADHPEDVIKKYTDNLQEAVDRLLEEKIMTPEELEGVKWTGMRDYVKINKNFDLTSKLKEALK